MTSPVIHRTLSFQSGKSTDIFVGSEACGKLAEYVGSYSKAGIFLLFDESLPESLVTEVSQALPQSLKISITAGEEVKTLESVKEVSLKLLELGCKRSSLIVVLGGGAATDFGGLVASLYMRGVDCIYVPTTLLAAVDASLGGKTGVNLGGVKNILGTFSHPKCVCIDTNLFETLPSRVFNSGVAEVIKHGLMADSAYFEQIEKEVPLSPMSDSLCDIIVRSIEIKSEIVLEDERESGKRKLLNFGHTFGHAVEAYSHTTQNPLFHGEAVAIGCVFAAYLSHLAGFISKEEVNRIETCFSKQNLPSRFSPAKFHREELLALLEQDKKSTSAGVRWVLIESMGKAVFDQLIPQESLSRAIDYIS